MQEKLKKVNSKYISKKIIINDDYDRVKREIGYIDFQKIPAKDLLEVLEMINTKSCLFGRNISDMRVGCDLACQDDPFYKEHIADHWVDNINCILGIKKRDVVSLIKAYAKKVDGTEKYEALGKVLSATLELRYQDWINDDKYDWDDHFFGSQKDDVDHNSVSEYNLLIKNPIPFDIIRIMNKEVKMFKLKDESELDSWEQKLNEKDRKYMKKYEDSLFLKAAKVMLQKEEKKNEPEEALLNF